MDRSKPSGFRSGLLIAQILFKNHESEFSNSVFFKKKQKYCLFSVLFCCGLLCLIVFLYEFRGIRGLAGYFRGCLRVRVRFERDSRLVRGVLVFGFGL